MGPLAASAVAAVVLGALHLQARRLSVLDRVPRSAWLSAASGVSVAYVFVHLLPEVAATQQEVQEAGLIGGIERHAWLMALLGLAVFYGLQLHAQRVQRGNGQRSPTPDEVGWVHIASYGLYNLLIGYLLLEQAERASSSLWAYAVAMGLHFLVNDQGLQEQHGELYHRIGRYVVSAAIVGGWALAALVHVPEAAVGLLLAFLAGSIVLNVLKEELPSERQSRLLPFLGGAAGYSALLLAV